MKVKIILDALETTLVPGPIDYAVILPPNLEECEKSLPVLLNLHGGGGSRDDLIKLETLYQKLWEERVLPPMVVASFSADFSWYINFMDGSELWEDFIFQFLDFIRATYQVKAEREFTYAIGISMGGRGALQAAFKHPDRFGLVAAMEPAIDPVLNFKDLKPRNRMAGHFRKLEEQKKRWGWPVDPNYYRSNNVASIAVDNAVAIGLSNLEIFLEVGDRDYFNLHDGAEYLHRVLWEKCIEHEYRLLRGVDHTGSSLHWRFEDAHRWIGRVAKKMMNSEKLKYPQPTPGQRAFYEWRMRGCPGNPPLGSEPFTEFDDVSAVFARESYPEPIKTYMNSPLDGVFRSGKN